MARFQVLMGKHVQKEVRERLIDGKKVERVVTCEYAAYDPKRNIVDTSKAVVERRDATGQITGVERHLDLDLCKQFNQPGFSEKFRKLQEPEQLAQDMNNDDLMRFARVAMEKGLITREDFDKSKSSATATSSTPTAPTVTAAPGQDPIRVAQLKRDLANVDKMPMVGLHKIAEDEELDVAHCRNAKGEWQESLVRKAVKTALEARLK